METRNSNTVFSEPGPTVRPSNFFHVYMVKKKKAILPHIPGGEEQLTHFQNYDRLFTTIGCHNEQLYWQMKLIEPNFTFLNTRGVYDENTFSKFSKISSRLIFGSVSKK